MEKESTEISLTESDFLILLQQAKQNDKNAMLKLIQIFDKDISHLSKFIKLPKEDAKQSIITAMIELFITKDL